MPVCVCGAEGYRDAKVAEVLVAPGGHHRRELVLHRHACGEKGRVGGREGGMVSPLFHACEQAREGGSPWGSHRVR